jgi:HAD superfamily hydrolase (TIGR01509 family)
MTAPAAPTAVVFDLDGTLVDTWATHARCLERTVDRLGADPVSPARLRARQRPTDLGTLEALVGAAASRALAVYHELLAEELASRPAPLRRGVPAVLAYLERLGVPYGVCTGRSRDGAHMILESARLDPRVVVCREDTPDPKPSPSGLRMAVDLMAADPSTALFVGDTAADTEQGRRAGVRTLRVIDEPAANGTPSRPDPQPPAWVRGFAS